MIIYLSVLLLLFFCIYEYDIRGLRQNRIFFIRLVLLVLIFVSGFAYRLGGDGMLYFLDYKKYGTISDLSFSYLTGFEGKQPGWVLLVSLCKTITSSYWFFKLVHAIIVNLAYVNLIRNNAKYVFSGLLIYFSLIYFNQNFQILRESLAISFFFFSIPFFKSGKWVKYYLLSLIAISFHIGAIFLLILPIVKLLGVNKYTIALYLVLGFFFIRYASEFLELIMTVKLDGDIQGKVYYYTHDLDTQYNFVYWSNAILNILFPLVIISYYHKKRLFIPYILPAVIGIIVYVVSLVLPIAYRFSNYFLIFSYILISDFIIRWIMSLNIRDIRAFFVYLFLIVFILFKGRIYLSNYGDTNIPSYVQYYPYASIFDKYEDPKREKLFKSIQ